MFLHDCGNLLLTLAQFLEWNTVRILDIRENHSGINASNKALLDLSREPQQLDSMRCGEALLAWRLCVLKKARAMVLAHDYEKGIVTSRWLKDLAKLSAFNEGPRLAREYLANAGIALVIEPHFKGTYLDGAAMLDQGRPIVALTLRHDRLDNFWFALLHELAHVGKHLNDAHPFFADDLDSPDEQDRKEKEADEMATHALIPPDVWVKAAVRESLSPKDVQAFARQQGISPAIVAGRVRHETGNYRLLARMLGQGEPSRFLA